MLYGIGSGWIKPPYGFKGRSMLGRQAVIYKTAPPVGADSLAQRLSPNLAVGDYIIAGFLITPSNAAFNIRSDGSYYANVNGSKIPQFVSVDGFNKTLGTLYGEGTFILNDRPPVPTNGQNFVGNTTFGKGVTVSKQLLATDPDGNPITWSVSAGALPPGLSLGATTGILSGTPTTLGSFGFTIRVSDQYGAYTDVPDSAIVASILPDFTGQQLSVATATVNAMGLTVTSQQTASSLPQNQIISQTPVANTPIVAGTTVVNFTVSDGSSFVGLVNLFPANIKGLTWNGNRNIEFNTSFQDSITGKPSTATYTQYPTVQWDLNYELLDQTAALDDLKKIIGLFNRQMGKNLPFLYVDPAFNTVINEVFFVGDGITRAAQLTAQYRVPGGPGLPEMIQSLQNAATITLTDVTAGTTLVQGTDYTVGNTGIVSFTTAPGLNHQIAWTGAFYYLCKFIVDDIIPEQFMQFFWQLKTIKFRSIII